MPGPTGVGYKGTLPPLWLEGEPACLDGGGSECIERELDGVEQLAQLDVERGHVDLGVHALQQQQHPLRVDGGDERVVAELA